MYVPFTGLGLYGGFRGQRWLKNRIQIFKQFVVPSLMAQTSQNFTIWISWRREDRNNPLVMALRPYLGEIFGYKRVVFTYAGVCFYDDKYEDKEARERLINSIHYSMPQLLDVIGGAEYIYMTIQPSDDLYHKTAVEGVQKVFAIHPTSQACGFKEGYICNYNNKEVSEYNPNTNPPFYTIKFPYTAFTEPYQHLQYTSLKHDVGKYKAGTPLPSHEYVGDCLQYAVVADLRGFMVGTHGENISTTYVHPFKGKLVNPATLKEFGIENTPVSKIKFSLRKKILRKFPHKVQRKLRYIFGEKISQAMYNFLRS